MEPKSEEFRELLVEMVKSSGRELIDRAEDLVGNGGFISGFGIRISFPTDGRMLIGCPTIEVTRSHISKKSHDILMEYCDTKRN